MEAADLPPDLDGFYRVRGDDAAEQAIHRPISTGDAFERLSIPAFDGARHDVIVVAHPCSLRSGVHLAEHVQVATVVPFEGRIRLGRASVRQQWAVNEIRRFPLPDLRGDGNDYVVALDSVTSLRSAALDLSGRIAVLDDDAVALLMTKYIENATRLRAPKERVFEVMAPAMEEISLLEEWNRALVDGDGGDVEARLNVEAQRFEDVFAVHRAAFADPAKRGGIRRAVAASRRARQAPSA